MKNKITIVAAFLAVMFAMTGMAAAANISGMKFNDLNHNGIRDPGEPGLANWTITLTSSGQEFPITTLTDSNGNYTFTGLAPGNYTVGEVLQSGWIQTAPKVGTYNITLNRTDVTGLDFGNINNISKPSGIGNVSSAHINIPKQIQIKYLPAPPKIIPIALPPEEGPPIPMVSTPVGPSGNATNLKTFNNTLIFSNKANVTNKSDPPGDFTLFTNSNTGESGSTVNEPSVANIGDYAFYTGNWYAARTIDGGKTWNYVNPTDDMPSFCCDQDVIYDQSRGIFIWYRQGSEDANKVNFFRLGISNDQGANWVFYDVYPTNVDGSWTNQNWDFPQLALSNNFLYIASNMYKDGDGKNWTRSVLLRFPLDALAAHSGFDYNYVPWTDNFNFVPVQGAKGTIYWGTSPSNNAFRLFSWDEVSTTFYWYDRTIPAWNSSGDFTCKSPDGNNMCGRQAGGAGKTGWVSNGIIGFFWNAGAGDGFPYPYSEAATFRESDKAYVGRPYIWNSNFAFQFTAVSPNPRGDLGLSLSYGGGNNYPSHAVGIFDGFSNNPPPGWDLWATNIGTNGPSDNSWGDYLRARPYKPSDLWAASGYTMQNGIIEPRYMVFGRQIDTPEFSIVANLSSLVAFPGTDATSSIFASTPISLSIIGAVAVNLSASGLPSGATASFSPNPVITTSSSIMTIQTSPSTPLGTYTITITGTELGITRSTQITLNVIPQIIVGSISGMKFNDLNGNGIKDPGEQGLAGWHIKLVGVNTLTNTPVNREEITDANGNYRFMDVSPGIYQVFEVMQGPNWVPTTPVTVPIVNKTAIMGINVNFGNRQIP